MQPKVLDRETLASHRNMGGNKTINLNKDLKLVRTKMAETTDAIVNVAKDVKGKTEEMLQEGIDDVKTKGVNLEEKVVNYIMENPLKAVGYSALAGALLAMFLRRK